MTNSTTILTCVLTTNPIQDRFTHNGTEIVVLRDELMLQMIGNTTCGKELLAVDAKHLWLAEDYQDEGVLKLVRVKAMTPEYGICAQCKTKHPVDALCCHTCGIDFSEDEALLHCGACGEYRSPCVGECECLRITNEELTMTLEEKMIAMVDSDTLGEQVALNIQSAMGNGSKLEDLLIAYLDSGLVSEDICHQLLATSEPQHQVVKVQAGKQSTSGMMTLRELQHMELDCEYVLVDGVKYDCQALPGVEADLA